jgi:tetratricopeptide (TPR) repeat protein
MIDSEQTRLLRQDQRERWQRGDRVRIEDYVAQRPDLKADPEGVLDLIYNEIVLREERGDDPRLQEYLDRFPEFEADLRLQFQVHQALEDKSLTRVTMASPEGPPTRPRLRPGAHPCVGDYEIVGELGRGGMGVVYRAYQPSLKRDVALKMILAGAHASAKDKDRFRIEAEAAARLQHPNIVQIYQVGEDEGCPFIAFELIEGSSLDRQLRGPGLPLKQAAELIEILARAMHHAHERGIVHRDLKPSNILLVHTADAEAVAPHVAPATRPLFPKITDFGLAKLTDEQAPQTASGSLLGTPTYMAPEQAVGRSRDVDRRADVYALGAILYELLTAMPPFEGTSMLDTLHKVRFEEPVRPIHLKPGLPRDLETICLKCLHKDPAHRYDTALDLADDLRRFLTHEPVRARPASAGERVFKWIKRRPTVAALLGALVLGAVASCSFLLWHQSDTTTKQARAAEKTLHAVEAAQDRYVRFERFRSDAWFEANYGELFPDADVRAHLALARDAVKNAFAEVNWSPNAAEPPKPDPLLPDAEQAKIRSGCHQLLLIVADIASQPAPGESSQARRDRAQQARAWLDRAADLAPLTKTYHMRRAQCLRQLGDSAGARQESTLAGKTEPSDLMDHFVLGRELFHKGDISGALTHFQAALQLQPDDIWSQLCQANCFLKLQRPANAKTVLDQCLKQKPDLIWAHVFRAEANEALGDMDAAQVDRDYVVAHDPSSDAAYVSHLNQAVQCYRQRKYAEAASAYQLVIAMKPDDYQGHIGLAQILFLQHKDGEAAAEFAEAIRLQPPSLALRIEPRIQGGKSLALARKFEDAVKACNETIQLQPSQPIPYGLRAVALLELGRYGEASASFDRYETLGGELVSDFYRGRGQVRMHLGDYKGAKDDYDHALFLRKDGNVYLHRGWAFFFQDAYQPALQDFDKAAEKNPDEADPYIGRGLANVYLDRYREAVADADKALRRKVEAPEMMHNIACIFALAGAKVARDPRAADRAALSDTWSNRAVAAVQRAMALAPPEQRRAFWTTRVMPDKALDSIHKLQAFKDMASEFGAPVGKR